MGNFSQVEWGISHRSSLFKWGISHRSNFSFIRTRARGKYLSIYYYILVLYSYLESKRLKVIYFVMKVRAYTRARGRHKKNFRPFSLGHEKGIGEEKIFFHMS